jgi:hypothetical protein
MVFGVVVAFRVTVSLVETSAVLLAITPHPVGVRDGRAYEFSELVAVHTITLQSIHKILQSSPVCLSLW